MKKAKIQGQTLDLVEIVAGRPKIESCGGYAIFEGIVRNHNHGKKVSKLEYTCYEPLALKELNKILDEANEKFGTRFIEIVHRVGDLAIGEPAVFIHALTSHRREAFGACEYVIDELKKRVPIWKKEFYTDGTIDWPRCQH